MNQGPSQSHVDSRRSICWHLFLVMLFKIASQHPCMHSFPCRLSIWMLEYTRLHEFVMYNTTLFLCIFCLGAWFYTSKRIESCLRHLGCPNEIERPLYVGRDVSATTAVGDKGLHDRVSSVFSVLFLFVFTIAVGISVWFYSMLPLLKLPVHLNVYDRAELRRFPITRAHFSVILQLYMFSDQTRGMSSPGLGLYRMYSLPSLAWICCYPSSTGTGAVAGGRLQSREPREFVFGQVFITKGASRAAKAGAEAAPKAAAEAAAASRGSSCRCSRGGPQQLRMCASIQQQRRSNYRSRSINSDPTVSIFVPRRGLYIYTCDRIHNYGPI